MKCSRHPTSEKMYVEEIDVGEQKPRQVVSALAKHVSLSDMMGRLVIVLCNIRPAKRMEVMSYGLLLGATSEDSSKVEPVNPPTFAKVRSYKEMIHEIENSFIYPFYFCSLEIKLLWRDL